MRHAVLRHHAAEQDFLDAESGQFSVQRRLVKTVGKAFDDHRRIRRGGAQAQVDLDALGTGIEEGRDALARVGDMLDRITGTSFAFASAMAASELVSVSSGVPWRDFPSGK